MQRKARSAKIQYDPPQGQGGVRLPETRRVGVGEGRHRLLRAKPLEWQEGNNLEVDRRSGGPSAKPKCPLAGGGGRAGPGGRPAKSHSPNEVFSLRENEMFCKTKQNEN